MVVVVVIMAMRICALVNDGVVAAAHALALSSGPPCSRSLPPATCWAWERLGDQSPDVHVVTGVEDEVALPTSCDQVEPEELAEVLGHGGGARADMIGKLVHGVLAVEQRPQDPQPGLDGQRL